MRLAAKIVLLVGVGLLSIAMLNSMRWLPMPIWLDFVLSVGIGFAYGILLGLALVKKTQEGKK